MHIQKQYEERQIFMNPLAIAAILFVAAAAVYIFYKIRYTKKNGIETEAVITRIVDEGVGTETSYSYFVRYTLNGQTVEARLSNPGFGKGLEIGTQIHVKYLPENPKIVVWVKQHKKDQEN